MIKKASVALVFVLSFALAAFAQETCNKVVEKIGGFSYCAPLNWDTLKTEKEKYTIVFGEKVNGMTPNINIKDEVVKMPLADYVELSTKNVLDSTKELKVSSLKVESQSDFASASMRGFKVVFVSVYNGITVRSIQYLFSGKGDRKYVVTATALNSDKDVLDSVFDKSMKTFQLID